MTHLAITKHVFGPVPSRRLGRSLGVDLVPFKICSYDCIYCQLGKTTNKTFERREWIPVNEILADVKEALSTKPDYITLSGSGEPTLHSGLGELIRKIKKLTDIPVAVLTNGSLLWQKGLQDELMGADLVIPSLDAGCSKVFEVVNRPAPEIDFEKMVQGLIDFRKVFTKKYWLEIFILSGYTSVPSEVKKIVSLVEKIRPDKVQLNTVSRPPTEPFALGVSKKKMASLAQMFHPVAEVITEFHGIQDTDLTFKMSETNVLELLSRRPCTIEDMINGLAIHRNEAVKHVEHLVGKGLIEIVMVNEKKMYRAKLS